jgi:hypothetical protein
MQEPAVKVRLSWKFSTLRTKYLISPHRSATLKGLHIFPYLNPMLRICIVRVEVQKHHLLYTSPADGRD